MQPVRPSFLWLLLPILGACSQQDSAAPPLPPNIVLIVADDLGYSDLGSYGSEISTPNLDSLAAHGVKLTNYHSGPTCGPTRAMLMTGIDSHPVGMAANAAALRRVTELQGRRGYDGQLNHDAVTVARLLADSGYQTFMSGKWDLGKIDGHLPLDRGFQRAFALLDGGGSHFADATGTLASDGIADYVDGNAPVDKLPG